MKKQIIVAAIAAAVAAPMTVLADATVYGKVRVATVYHDDDLIDAWGLENESSRLGIKGSEDLGGGLKAIYKMEFAVDVTGGAGSGAANTGITAGRNAYVGLAGGWGTALAGRHDTPMKMSTGKLDLFNDTTADADQSGGGITGQHSGLFNDIRAGGVIAYISPNMSGFTLAGAAIQNVDTDDFANAYSLAGMYSNGPWFASLAYEVLQEEVFGLASTEDDTKWRVGLGLLDMSGFTATIVYEDRSDIAGVDRDDSQAWQLQGAYDFGNNRVKAMYGQFDDDSDLDIFDFDVWAIGLQHNFSKRTDVQVIYRAKDFDDLDVEDNTFSLQLNHSF